MFERVPAPRGVRGEITEQELGSARATINELLDHLERTLMPGPWIGGGHFTLAEISIAPYMFRLAALGGGSILVTAAAATRPRVVQRTRWAARLQDGGFVAGRVGRRLRGGRTRREGELSLIVRTVW
jgi:glutathione S-transferase